MKIACIATSRVPATTANSIQMMKVCGALTQLGHKVCLWVPGNVDVSWEKMSSFYGLETPFEVRGIPSLHLLRRYDFALFTQAQLHQWKADLVYTWLVQSGLHALNSNTPAILEIHDRPMGQFGPRLFQKFVAHRGKKELCSSLMLSRKCLRRNFTWISNPARWGLLPMALT